MHQAPSCSASLPERSVSEDGTFCESFNDAISRLGHDLEVASAPEAAGLFSARPGSAQSGANGGLNESIFDDVRYFPCLRADQSAVAKFDGKQPEVLLHATLRALVVQLTSPEVIDYNLICDFFLTYRTFTDAAAVLTLLLTRLVWALQYIGSGLPPRQKLGQLVLLRTFVVLRHWILNYFLDDFRPDARLCDMFARRLNHITGELRLVHSGMAFEVKVLADLKTHWLAQLAEFFGAAAARDASTPVFAVPLPMAPEYFEARRLPKSSTEVSLHTNPSFRRLAMLSLYDPKPHHRGPWPDGVASPENGPLPISNLVSQHQSSRVSLDTKMAAFHTRRGAAGAAPTPLAARREPVAPKHNHMNLKDSSLALKKTTAVHQNTPRAAGPVRPGFATNGRVKLPSPRIAAVVPLAPLENTGLGGRADPQPPAPHDLAEPGRRKSLKRIVEDWTRAFDKSTFSPEPDLDTPIDTAFEHAPTYANAPREIAARVDVLSARIVDELEFVIRYYIADTPPAVSQKSAPDAVDRRSIALSPSENIAGAPMPTALEKDRTRASAATTKDLSIQDISELNIEKIDNLFSQSSIGDRPRDLAGLLRLRPHDSLGSAAIELSKQSKHSSFAGKVTSINWNDDGNLFLDNSALLCDSSARPGTQFYDTSGDANDMGPARPQNSRPENRSSDFDSSDADRYDKEVLDLGIAISPQSLKRKRAQRFSLHHQFAAGSLGKAAPSLLRNSSDSFHTHRSMKSYMSYDSALSASSEHSESDQHSANLKKKHGYHDLRRLAQDGNPQNLIFTRLSTSSNISASGQRVKISMASHLSRTSSLIKKNSRVSALCALMELPFNLVHESYASTSTRAFVQDDSGKLVDLSLSSVFSNAVVKEQLCVQDSADDSIRMSSASVAIPGMNNNILRELASIPDETFTTKNPIQYALFKLEGRYNSSEILDMHRDTTQPNAEDAERPQTAFLNEGKIVERAATVKSDVERESVGDAAQKGAIDTVLLSSTPEPSVSPPDSDDVFHDTDDILDEINNANTEDVIGYSSDIEYELKNRPITPIKKRSRSTLLLSQPTSNGAPTTVPNSESSTPDSLLNPKLVLDVYQLATENLTVKQVLAAGSHVSFILSYTPRAIAEHFTMIERDMMQDIDWKELIELQWNKDLTPVNSWLEIIVNDEYYNKNKGVNLVIARFNLVVNWIISEILLTKTQEERCEVATRFIHVAYHSYEMQNFSSLMQVVLALTSGKVSKLQSTWDSIDPSDILALKHLEKVTSPLKNFVSMRVSTNQIKPSKGCIPFLGLYLSDLIFNAERPKYVKKKELAKNTMAGAEVEKMINFARFRTSVHIVKSLSQSIEWSQNYDFAVDEELLRKCLYITSLDEEEMNICLKQTETQPADGH
ncbi:ras GEF [Metschnikowia bicuspidata var. bicuspidata NRRL YB-4993]|uniref:Ras GEF n=1 Tax=Metschnikowia bicuspidata var. bicuspidata NRRL YB-4993 TaxID=869754 RepID=A0A1A0HIW6_9ASCO|nr:ras GEF [Metschnikowia bicuspidata var. bicuspidata NRRL YB-4993]OBA23827.1 ras GEF [Metschnikowia bicuspidata var. bicuspidata NRRL YB-4993]